MAFGYVRIRARARARARVRSSGRSRVGVRAGIQSATWTIARAKKSAT